MDITLVLAVFNKLHLTKNCYNILRENYPYAPLVISSGGSTDGTKEWLNSLNDENLTYFHDDDRLTFSDNYNAGIKLVDTNKLVLIHNDMVIGKFFLENIEELLTENMVLTYTTVEPPIFNNHKRPGKVVLNMGTDFENFDFNIFNQYIEEQKNKKILQNGASFFMAGFKKMFENVGGFDGFTFTPAFCEDDDFLLRAKLKGYDLKTTESAIAYHFVSQTSRFSDDFKNHRIKYEVNSNRNFVRKWGIPFSTFHEIRYWEDNDFNYPFFTMTLNTKNILNLYHLEPFFDKINLGYIPEEYIKKEQPNTRYDLRSKFTLTDSSDVIVIEKNELTEEDYHTLHKLRLSIPYYDPGEYEIGNMQIQILRKIKEEAI